QELNGQMFEAVLISPTLYLKTPQGWQQERNPGALASFSQLANPTDFLKKMGFEQLVAESNKNGVIDKLVGTEQIGGVQTRVYQYEIHSSGINATYKYWLGTDGKIYRMDSESERLKSSTTIEFDPSIKV